MILLLSGKKKLGFQVEIISIELIILISVILLSFLVVFAYILIADKAIQNEEANKIKKAWKISGKSESLTDIL